MSDESEFTSKLFEWLPKMASDVIFIESKLNFERIELFFLCDKFLFFLPKFNSLILFNLSSPLKIITITHLPRSAI